MQQCNSTVFDFVHSCYSRSPNTKQKVFFSQTHFFSFACAEVAGAGYSCHDGKRTERVFMFIPYVPVHYFYDGLIARYTLNLVKVAFFLGLRLTSAKQFR